MKKQKNLSIWKKVPDMEKRLVELIHDNLLIKEGTAQKGVDKILLILKKEFSDILQEL